MEKVERGSGTSFGAGWRCSVRIYLFIADILYVVLNNYGNRERIAQSRDPRPDAKRVIGRDLSIFN